jgi:RNA polymerase sigma-70 factor, ECF subfamily
MPLEAQLAERASSGDAVAFRQIYERHSPAVWRFLRDLIRDDSAAEECMQETFVRAHTKLSTVREGDKLCPWLLGIARNVWYEHSRKRRRMVGSSEATLEAEADAGPSPEASLLGREADRILAAALSRLSEERRAALLLQMDHGLAYADIAKVMGWSLAKVKVEIHRARLVLREDLKRYLGDE